MDVTDLRIFDAVARLGSMSRAAIELHTVQSNVTGRIRTLEREVGIALFQRHVRGVSITPAGQRMLPFAARIASLITDARQAALDEGPPKGALSIGALWSTGTHHLPGIVSDFSRQYPQVTLSMTAGTCAALMDAVASDELDGAFVSAPGAHPDIDAIAAFSEELVLVTPASIRSLEEVQAATHLKAVVFAQGCTYRQRLESLLMDLDVKSTALLELESVETIISCVSSGVGISLLPRSVVARAALEKRVIVHAVPSSISSMEVSFIRRRDSYFSSAMRAFVELACLRDGGSSHLCFDRAA